MIFYQNLASGKFIFFFTFLTVVTTELLISLQSYYLTGNPFPRTILSIGFITSFMDAFFIFIIVGMILKHLKNLQRDKENLLVDLKEKSELLRTVIDENPDPVIVKNWDGKFILANEACAELYGTTTEKYAWKR